jgi:Tfp pilus assembly protein PilF
MLQLRKNNGQRLTARLESAFAIGAILLSVLVGCASDSKVRPPVVHEASVARLEDGREGFVITEVPQMDSASRRDFHRAVAKMKDNDYAAAIELLEKVTAQSPGVTAPYIDIAMAYERTGQFELAEENLKSALKLVPDHPVACNEYGLLYRKTGRFTEARAMYEKTIARYPDYYPAHKNLGILCDLYLDDSACALKQYQIYSEARPEDKKVKLWIADLRARNGSR